MHGHPGVVRALSNMTDVNTTNTGESIIHRGLRNGTTPTVLIQSGAAGEAGLIQGQCLLTGVKRT
jgi:hypothetical protein